MRMDTTRHLRPEPRYGWVMVGVAVVGLALNFGALISVSVFLKPLAAEFGWPRAEVAFAYTVAVAAIGIGGIGWGWLADRYGTRPVVLFGMFIQGLALFLLARLESLWQLYLFYTLLGGLGFAASNVPLITNVGQWFTSRKGLALGIVSAGGALGQAVVPVLATWIIARSTWSSAYTALAILYWSVGIPLALLVRTPARIAEAHSAAAGGSTGNAAAPVGFDPKLVTGWLSVATIFCCYCMAVPLVHLVPLATDLGIEPQSAAAVFAVLMVTSLLGRILIGRLADALGAVRTYLLCSAGQTVTVFWFTQSGSLAGLVMLAVLFGLGFSGVMPCIWICVRELVPARMAGAALGVVVLFAWLGMGLGGWLGGFFYDLTGDYTWSFATAALAGMVNLVVVGNLWLYLTRRRSGLQAQPAAL
jgi:MFS family permease